jgi:hypothetical protein
MRRNVSALAMWEDLASAIEPRCKERHQGHRQFPHLQRQQLAREITEEPERC